MLIILILFVYTCLCSFSLPVFSLISNISSLAFCGALSRAINASALPSIYTTIPVIPPPRPELWGFTTPTHRTHVMAASTTEPPCSKISLKINWYSRLRQTERLNSLLLKFLLRPQLPVKSGYIQSIDRGIEYHLYIHAHLNPRHNFRIDLTPYQP